MLIVTLKSHCKFENILMDKKVMIENGRRLYQCRRRIEDFTFAKINNHFNF